MPKSCYQSSSQFIACDEFLIIVNVICNLFDVGINSNLSQASVSLVGAGILW